MVNHNTDNEMTDTLALYNIITFEIFNLHYLNKKINKRNV